MAGLGEDDDTASVGTVGQGLPGDEPNSIGGTGRLGGTGGIAEDTAGAAVSAAAPAEDLAGEDRPPERA